MGSKICAQFFLVKVRLFYLEGWRIIEAANEVFGFNGWSHSVIDIKIDYVSHLINPYQGYALAEKY